MQSFLETIAKQYAGRYSDLSQFCFIFPGRRSGTFFLKHLKGAIGHRKMIAPQTITISDFTQSLSPFVCDNRIDLLFLLYRCYLELYGYSDTKDVPEEHSFERFRSWGEIILSDFNEIDTHLVNAEELYKNLRDLNEISTDFLTDEQREVMETYFDIHQPRKNMESFWRTFDYDSHREEKNETDIKEKFLYTWQRLADLYKLFNSSLEKEGLTYSGRAARQALDVIRKQGNAPFDVTKIVFVGFNVLTAVEWHIFRELKSITTIIDGREEPFADFVWDLTGPVMLDKFNSAARFVRKGIENFPKPVWLDLSACETDSLPPVLNILASPSNVMQSKLAGSKVKELHEKLTQAEFDEARIAVVLPDEGLLLPMIHSLPDTMIEEPDPDNKDKKRRRRSIGVNLTMGLPLRHTPVVSFVALLRRLQTRLRRDTGGVVFFHEDVEAVLAHPFTHVLLGSEEVMEISGVLQTRRLKYITQNFFRDFSAEAQSLFTPLPQDAAVEDTIGYLDNLLQTIDEKHTCAQNTKKESTDEEGRRVTMESLTHTHIETYRRALSRLIDACRKRNIFPTMFAVFLLADRLISGEKVMFEGEPLHGLQIMGLLETRSLDFDHIIIPSMNDGVFPRRMRSHTFIPDSLRLGFGLPTGRSQESIFAYYFYRMICRAQSVTMIYDARTGGSHSGDPSRFILQLRHLYARHGINTFNARFDLPISETEPIEISKKDAEVKEKLDEYLTDKRYLSSSSLQKYLQCPVQFYFNYLAGVSVQETPGEFMTAIDLGNIVHDAMMRVYLDPSTDTENVKGILKNPIRLRRPTAERIKQCVHNAVNSQYLHRDIRMPLAGEPAIQAEIITKMVTGLVNLDASTKGLELFGVEVKMPASITLDSGKRVPFIMIIDRLDRITDGNGTRYRIVDYKTGEATMKVTEIKEIFRCDRDSKYFFQLLLYALLAHKSKLLGHIHSFEPILYHLLSHSSINPEIGPSKKKIKIVDDRMSYPDGKGEIHESLIADFEEELKSRLSELFDIEKPFVQTNDLNTCGMCNFKSICGR